MPVQAGILYASGRGDAPAPRALPDMPRSFRTTLVARTHRPAFTRHADFVHGNPAVDAFPCTQAEANALRDALLLQRLPAGCPSPRANDVWSVRARMIRHLADFMRRPAPPKRLRRVELVIRYEIDGLDTPLD